MIERLQRALEHIEALSPEVQDQLAEIIEDHTEAEYIAPNSLVGAWRDLPDTFDEMLDALDSIRHTNPPTPPIEEQLGWMDTADDQ
ncbi:MAG: hypothetical protein ACRDHP_01695 [Ktedonobacterales bacterium]